MLDNSIISIKVQQYSSKKITLEEEIADLEREIALRERKYPEWRNVETDPSKIDKMKDAHDHQLACSYTTLARLKALIPVQGTLFA